MSKFIMQLDAPLSTTHSSGFTASFTGAGSAAAAGSTITRRDAAHVAKLISRMGSERPGEAAEAAEHVVVLHERAVGDAVLQLLVVHREGGAQVFRHVVVRAQARVPADAAIDVVLDD